MFRWIVAYLLVLPAVYAGSSVPFAELSVEEQLVRLAQASPDERHALLTELKKEMETDKLTGANNRLALRRIERTLVTNHAQVAFIIIDLDHFKRINDTLGHAAGDDVLRSVGTATRDSLADMMKELVNKYTRDHLVRFGGEEFLVILEQSTAEDAKLVAERLREKIQSTAIVRYPDLKVTASFGIAAGIADSALTWEALFKAADAALYEAKHGGRNQVRVAAEGKVCEILAGRR